MPAQAIPSLLHLPSFDTITLYTGNLMRSGMPGRAHKKSNTELFHALDTTLAQALNTPLVDYDNRDRALQTPRHPVTKIRPDDRADVEVTAKVFLLHDDVYPDEALRTLRAALDIQTVDNVLVATQQKQRGETWQALESGVTQGQIGRWGVVNFSREDLEALLNKQEARPTMNQIRVATPELMETAKRHGIELLHNNDGDDLVNTSALTKLLADRGVVKGARVVPRWVVKYHVLVRCRGVVADKGYIVVGDVLA
ncbi:hypothetical protein BCR43DRAFT_519555 [Syncephalastrum racemosum]|uniref:GCS light chain n=1 Tax=Syncephalastrum racemosum TaxID=13706 RepID=A0A1X2HRK5_SYNRA|nr:hypothetical protein BCR43DRAFT_519555 [Syncephalastrum racemosum]